ncbi:hypothetical protein [Salsipaludibacter albus]|uniref:hypothetical protein n=1 Tax=Salsipaludibacter albus TaxID=2849650 RepID=UPI001EE436A9|nr:hypothetical protein [Salsipaludibacter albus]MBY5162163.1 hypothetical protein [Salsipaludibacter albus]
MTSTGLRTGIDSAGRRVLLIVVVAALVGCGTAPSPVEQDATSPPAPGVEPADPSASPSDMPVEPGTGEPGSEPATGTAITVELAGPVEVGSAVRVPVVVTVGTSEPTWDAARLSTEVEGHASAELSVDVDDLAPGGTATGDLVVDVPAGTVDEPSESSIDVTLHLLRGDEEVARRRDTVAIVAGPDRAWLAHGSTAEARRAMLGDLLAEGSITREQHDTAIAGTTESTGRATVEVVTPADAPD